jgi:nucleotidyltransferase/DNA polymerase involved in DNA repair
MAIMQGARRVIASVDQTAARLELEPGMTVTHAQSLIPDLEVIDAMPEEDEAALIRLGLWCIRYSPLVTPNPPDGVFIDVAGSAHLFQGEAALIADLCKRLAAEAITAKASLADTAGCAWALARVGEEQLVSPGRASDAIASLPIASLRLAPSTVQSLADVGIERVAQLASKPRGSLRTRFGGEVLLRLDQALGNANELLPSLLPPEVPRTELRFAEPVGDPDDLKRIIEKLADRLCLDLEARGIGARRLDLVFMRVDNIAQAARIGLSRPYREPKHLAKLLSERLVVIDPGFGIESASLTASWVEAVVERQTIDHTGGARPEAIELPVSLPAMTAAREVVEDYCSTGLSLRQHPVAFLRPQLDARRIVPCISLRTAGNDSRIELAGLVLVRQMPGSAKGVMFITIEDETANANLIVWPQVFEENRRPILHATMMACFGRVQHASGVTHLIVERVRDLSADLRRVSGIDNPFPLTAGRGDEAKHGGHGLDSRQPKTPPIKPRDMYGPDLHIDTLKIKARSFH